MTIPFDTRSKALWLFDERHDSVLPSETIGNIAEDLAEGATNTLPAVAADEFTAGWGREFIAGSTTGLEAEDTDDVLQLTRGVTVLAVVALDVDAQDTYGSPGTIVQMGQSVPFGLRLTVTDVATRTVRLQMFQNTEAGFEAKDLGVTFAWPSGDVPLFLAASREVVDGELVVTYHVSGHSLTQTALGLDVNSGTGEDVYVGVGHNGSGYENYLDGVISYLEIVGEAVSKEELEWIWRRFSVDAPRAYAALRRLLPPDVYSDDPDSLIQKEVQRDAGMFSVVRSMARRLRDYRMPAKAWGALLERWESMTKLAPLPGDWIARRRERVGGFLYAQQGHRVSSVQAQLEELLGTDAANVQILEYDNDISHDFATDAADYIQEDGGGSWTVGSGVANFAVSSSTMEFRGRLGTAGLLLWSLSGVETRRSNGADDCWLAAKLTVDDGASTQDDAMAGVCIGNSTSDAFVILAVTHDGGGGLNVFRGTYQYGVLSWSSQLDNLGSLEVHLRIRHVSDGDYELRWGTSASAADSAVATDYAAGSDFASPGVAGLVGCGLDDGPYDLDVDFDDLLIHEPNNLNRFYWYAYRDPALGGTYDLAGADQVVQRIKPAHTYARAIDAPAVICDTAGAGCDRGPIGK